VPDRRSESDGARTGVETVHRYPIEILHLLVSPGHNYFGRPRNGPADHPTHDLDHAVLVAGKGIVGDRYYGKAAHLDASVTLFGIEALELVAERLGVPVPDPLLARRNVMVRGADLNGLRGQVFSIEAAGGDDRVVLAGGRPAAPCAWMDRMLAPGAHAALRGRGGLRCRVVEDGTLRRGPAFLVSPVPLDPGVAGLPDLRPGRLP
jgi:MOSC domain-containing protein YiiM